MVSTTSAPPKVEGIIKALSSLENDIDSLNTKLAEMKKNLNVKAQKEIETLMEKTREMATKEAEVIINTSRKEAEAEAAKISQEGESKLSAIQSQIDSNFDDAVKHVVLTVLKA